MQNNHKKRPRKKQTTNDPRVLFLISLIFPLVGLLLLGIAPFTYRYTQTWLETAYVVEATVIDHAKVGSNYAAIYEYTDHRDVKRTYQSSRRSSPARPKVGEVREIIYLADHPTDVYRNTFLDIHGATLLMLFMGTIFLGLGMLFAVIARKEYK